MKRFVHLYLESGASQYASMLAFSIFVALLPLLLGVLSILSLYAPARRLAAVKHVLISWFPAELQGSMAQVVRGVGAQTGLIIVLSLVALLWFSTGLFSTAGFALNRIHGLPNRSFVSQRLRGLWLPFPLFGALYLAVGSGYTTRFFNARGYLEPVFLWLALTIIILFLYRMAPGRSLPRAAIMPGALLAAAAIVALAFVFPLYATVAGRLSSGAQIITGILVLVAWIYAAAQAVLGGALINQLRIESAVTKRRPALEMPQEPRGA